MTSHFLKLSFRNLFRRKFSTLANILGLAIGFTGFIAILIYVLEERSYDRHIPERENIYRVVHNTFNKDRKMIILSALFHEHLERIPEIKSTARIFGHQVAGTMRSEKTEVLEQKMIIADAPFLGMFGYELEKGTLESFRNNPTGIVMSQDAAQKYFGDKDPMGEVLNFRDRVDFTVVGILKERPGKSHLDFDLVANFEGMRQLNTHMFTHWGNHSTTYYVKLQEDANPNDAGEKIFDLYDEVRGTTFGEKGHFMYLQPLNTIYLESSGIESSSFMLAGNATTLYILSVAAIMILLLACVNYINLTTAQATRRAREVGVRKVLGAGRKQLLRYFLSESLLLCVIAFLVSLVLLEMFLPVFFGIVETSLQMDYLGTGNLWIWLPGIVILVALLAGLYPGAVMSGFQPLDVLKGSTALISRKVQSGLNANLRYRQILLVLQITISVALVLASTFIVRQNQFAMQDTGFEKENLIVIHNPSFPEVNQNYHRLKNTLETYPFITAVSGGAHVPTETVGNQGHLSLLGQASDQSQPVYFAPVDFGYFEALQTKVLQGRTFDKSFAMDSTTHVVLNESAARALGLNNPVGEVISGFWDGTNKKVIGMVEDMNFQSVHNKVQPTAFFLNYEFRDYGPASQRILVRFRHNNISEVTEAIEKAWKENMPGSAVSYFFMDQQYEKLYQSELQTAGMGSIFSFLAILLAIMGLWGTTAYVLNSRRKEFGIRKVLGASSLRLAKMISLEFTVMAFISSVIAWGVVYYFIDGWLENFVYSIRISFLPFVVTAMVAWALCMLIVNTIVFNEARHNPVKALKHE
ncbi:MAG: ABC transporter permease [Bacteroidota bacterium]